jgi:gas vesicle protein
VNNQEDKNPGKKSSSKLLVSLIIGGAIASVLGLGLAPKKTKKLLKKNAKNVWNKIENKINELEDDNE